MTAAPPTDVVEDHFFSPDDRAIGADEQGGAVGQFWLRGEYLLWWTKGSQLPALVTTGLPGATPLQGALGQPGTQVIYGGSDRDNRPRSGARFTAGFWCDPCKPFGFEAS